MLYSPQIIDLSSNRFIPEAVGDHTIVVSGIAPKCKILPVKIFVGPNEVANNVMAGAIRYAGKKADILSNIWETTPSNDVEQAIRDVVKTGRSGKGCPIFAATGNKSRSYISIPSSVPEAIAVGASTNKGLLASYSNHGEGIDFVAPSNGGTRDIFTTDVAIRGRGFNAGDADQGDAAGLYTNSFGGTSSATPLAAGVAALILSLNPDLTWDQVRRYMRNAADKIDLENGNYVNGYSLLYGFGRINANKALKAVKDDMENVKPGNIIEKNVSPGINIPDYDQME